MTPIIQCAKCEGLGLVRYYSVMTGGRVTTLSVARECDVCEGRGFLTAGPLIMREPQRLNAAHPRAASR